MQHQNALKQHCEGGFSILGLSEDDVPICVGTRFYARCEVCPPLSPGQPQQSFHHPNPPPTHRIPDSFNFLCSPIPVVSKMYKLSEPQQKTSRTASTTASSTTPPTSAAPSTPASRSSLRLNNPIPLPSCPSSFTAPPAAVKLLSALTFHRQASSRSYVTSARTISSAWAKP